MNLKNNPTEQQLQLLMAKADDNACDHMVWVSKDGEVHIEAITDGYVLL